MTEPAKGWSVILLRQPEKMLHRLPKGVTRRLWAAIRGLAEDPRPPGCRKLAGYENLYRLRVGDWRVSYAIHDERRVVLIIEIGTRDLSVPQPQRMRRLEQLLDEIKEALESRGITLEGLLDESRQDRERAFREMYADSDAEKPPS